MTKIENIIKERILLLDGGLGTLIQSRNLTEEDYRGERFTQWEIPLKGCNDILVITRPDILQDIHTEYLESGADIISTDTFNANTVSMEDYGLQEYVYEINLAAARLARETASKYSTAVRPRFVAGSVGPTNRSASMSPDVNRPAYRNVTFDDQVESYTQQIKGLIDGGADMILIETVFDTLNAKAAIFALRTRIGNRTIPLMISGTVTDASGRTLSGQTVEAFYNSVGHAGLLTIGLNCAFGARQMLPYVERLARLSGTGISAHPNAGLPNVMGGYDESAAQMAAIMEEYMSRGLLNIVGGCCGTTPEHIAALARIAPGYAPHKIEPKTPETILSGLEPLVINENSNFINIGERTNVAGSAKFARLIREKDFDQALAIAVQQVAAGAQIIDVCMDAPMIDAREAMVEFLNLMASEPAVSRVPLMVDSSSWEVLEAGLKCAQGKSVVNSISLKEGEAEFLRRAMLIRDYGSAAVVMLFDEKGQADSFARKIEVAARAYKTLTEAGFPPQDIIFDPNVLAIATGLPEHDNYAVDFIEACRWISANCPYSKISGGVSNLSFSYRGNNTVREAMHSVFLYHAMKAGMSMGIVNPSMLQIYSQIEPRLLELTEDVVLNRRPAAAERLTEYASTMQNPTQSQEAKVEEWRQGSVSERIIHALVKGVTTHIAEDTLEAYDELGSAIEIIDNVLMEGMKQVGELFGEGKMFLPQVVKSARVMKEAVAVLEPHIKEGETGEKGAKIVLATVKGDVHDIGKNIVSIVLQCNGFRVVDLGVMVPSEKIIETAIAENADIVLLSGLITPSLEEMRIVAEGMERAGSQIPIAVGGATTSALHTAVKIAPSFSGIVAHSTDASGCVRVVSEILGNPAFATGYKQKQKQLREDYQKQQDAAKLVSLKEARDSAVKLDFSKITAPRQTGRRIFKDYPIEKIISRIDWSFMFSEWDLRGRYPEILDHPVKGEHARKLFADANTMLERLIREKLVEASAIAAIVPTYAQGDDIVIRPCDCCHCAEVRLPQLRNQTGHFRSLADFVSPDDTDHLALFALGITNNTNFTDEYDRIMAQILCDRLAEAFALEVTEIVMKEMWGSDAPGLRVAFGYPSVPDHAPKRKIFDILEVEDNIPLRLTENYMIEPVSALSGIIFGHPDADFFSVGLIGNQQLEDYARRTGTAIEKLKIMMPNNIK